MTEYMNSKKRTIPLIALIVSTMFIMAVSFIYYSSYVEKYEKNHKKQLELSDTEIFAAGIDKSMSVYYDILGRFAPNVMESYDSEHTLNAADVPYPFLAAGVASEDGMVHFGDSSSADFSGMTFLADAYSGKNSAGLTPDGRLAVCIPSFDENGNSYAVVGIISLNTLTQYCFSENEPYILCSGDSTVIFSGVNEAIADINPPAAGDSIFSALPQNAVEKSVDADISSVPKENMLDKLNTLCPVINLDNAVLTIAPVKSSGLYAVGLFSKASSASSEEIFANTHVFLILFGVSFFLLVCFVVFSEINRTKQLVYYSAASAIEKKRLSIALTNVSCLVFEYLPREDVLDITFVSDEFSDVSLGKREHFVSEHIYNDMFPDETQEKIKRLLKEVVTGEQNASEIVKIRLSKQNDHRWFRLTVSKAYETKKLGVTSIVGTFQDIHEQIKKEKKLTDRAEKDQLTSLYNRITSERLINAYLSRQDGFKGGAFMLCDLDNFKFINDTYGHSFGDAVLVTFSTMLDSAFRSSDIICRIGGDEFAVLIKGLCDPEEAVRKADVLRDAFFKRRSSGKMQKPISCSIGIAMLTPDDSFATLYEHADNALYAAKNNGKNHVCIYSVPQRLSKENPDETPIEN